MKTLQTTLIAIFAICLASCNSNSKAEDQIDQIVAAYEKVPKLIDGVTDLDSAKKANTEILKITDELIALDKDLKTMKVTSSKKEELEKKLVKENKQFQTNVENSTMELAKKDPAAAAEIKKGIMKMALKIAASQ